MDQFWHGIRIILSEPGRIILLGGVIFRKSEKSMRIKSYLLSTTILASVAGLLAAGTATPASADGLEASGSVAITSDYVYRGISQTLEEPAIQGSVDIGINGFYAGIWGSNLNFGDGDEAHVELDYYAGYASDINDFSYDVGLIYYDYPGSDNALDYAFVELQGNGGYDFGPVSVSGGINWSPEFFGKTGDATYLSGGVSWPAIADRLTIDAHLGRQILMGPFDYTDWSLGATVSAAGFDFSLTYYDTNMSDADFFGDNDLVDARIVGTIARSF